MDDLGRWDGQFAFVGLLDPNMVPYGNCNNVARGSLVFVLLVHT